MTTLHIWALRYVEFSPLLALQQEMAGMISASGI
jgi:hypothetical protein